MGLLFFLVGLQYYIQICDWYLKHLKLARILSVWGPLPPPGVTPTPWNSPSPRLSFFLRLTGRSLLAGALVGPGRPRASSRRLRVG